MPDVLRHQAYACRACGTPLDAAMHAGAGRAKPTDGDFSICGHCGEVSVYAISAFGVVSLREATLAELHIFNQNPRLVFAREAVLRFPHPPR